MALSVILISSGTNPRAAFGDVAVAHALRGFEFLETIFGVERMHLQGGDMNQVARADKLLVFVMLAQDMADILAEKTFDAFAELLDAIDVGLGHPPGAVRGIGRAWFERLDLLLHAEIPRNIGDQIFDQRKSFHGSIVTGSFERQLIETGHAHQPRHSIYFGGAGAAFAGFAIPATSKVGGLAAWI